MTRRRSKFRINTKGKSYAVIDSPFYKLTSKRKLAALLQVDLADLSILSNDVGNYSVFSQIGKNGKPRMIEQPVEKLDMVHSRIASLLCRLTVPDFVHSGIKKRSYVTNAKTHSSSTEVLTLDIKSYYQSTKKSAIYKFFANTFMCSPDVSRILAEMCTYEEHIPTGSRVSMPLALWVNMAMFRDLETQAKEHSLNMTVYVDDITFSGDKVPETLWLKLRSIIKSHGHLMHPKKTKHYRKDDVKIVTGVAIKSGTILIKNEQHKRIRNDLVQWIICRDTLVPKSLTDRLIGRLNALSVVEPKLRDKARSIKNYTANQETAK